MAVEHMVWIKFNQGVTEERINEHISNLQSLQNRIPVAQRVVVAKNFTDRANGFTHGLIVTVPTRDDLPTYLDHPDHIEVAGPLKQDAQLMAMDIEI